MALYQELSVGELQIGNSLVKIVKGSAATRLAVLNELDGGPSKPAVGSIYISTTGVWYGRVANAGANTDWQKFTTTAAD